MIIQVLCTELPLSLPSMINIQMLCTELQSFSINSLQAMVNVQMLSELEEVIQYKLVPERREAIRLMWWNRLQVCEYKYKFFTAQYMIF